MKRFLNLYAATCLSVLLLIGTVPLLTTGCAGTKSEQAAYRSLYTVGVTANLALDTWLQYAVLKEAELKAQVSTPAVADKLLSLAKQEAEVRRVYNDFRQSYSTALSLAEMDADQLSPVQVTQLSADLAALVARYVGKTVGQ